MKKLIQSGLLITLFGTTISSLSLADPIIAQESAQPQSTKKTKADNLFDLGIEQEKIGLFREAKASWEEALNLYRQIGDQQHIAASLNNLGATYRSLGEYTQAIDHYQQSLEIKRQIGDQQGIAGSLENLGIAYGSLGKYGQAIDHFQQSLELSRQIGDQQDIAASLNNLGIVYNSLGEYSQAIDHSQQSLEIFRQMGDQQNIAAPFSNLGNAYNSLGEYTQAIDHHQQSLEIKRQIGDQQGIAASLNNLGIVSRNLGEYTQAINHYQQSLEIFRQIGDQQGIANSLGNLGHVSRNLGEYTQAINHYQQSLEIFRQIGDQQGIADSLWGVGLLHLFQEQYGPSQAHLEASIQMWESLHRNLTVPQQISFFDTQASTYSTLQAVLVAQKKPLEALLIAEQGRTRALNKQLSSTNAPFNLEQIQQVAKAQNATIVEYTLVSNSMIYAWVIRPDGSITHHPINGQELGQSLESFEQQTRQWLENIRGIKDPNQDNAVPQLLAKANLEEDTPQSPSQSGSNLTYLRQLHALLIEPIEASLPKHPDERVIFIPHRSLFFVPFPALLGKDSTYLVDKHTILTAPSIQALMHLQNQQHQQQKNNGPKQALVIGNPTSPSTKFETLPGAEGEAKFIANLFNTEPLLGDQATETLVREKLFTADIIHLAAHGKFNPVDPLSQFTPEGKAQAKQEKLENLPPQGGSIVLAKDPHHDGYFQTLELTELTADQQLNAELVVLSACETGLGKVTGDGIVGLSRSLLAAGVPSVVVSLWSVSDHSTTLLMNEFYTNAYGKGWDKAKSLTEAMRTIKKKHTDPGKWAAFTLIGLPE